MAIVSVQRPSLTTEERAKRMEEIKKAAVRLILETEKAKRSKQARKDARQ
jgi:hypothetical protein